MFQSRTIDLAGYREDYWENGGGAPGANAPPEQATAPQPTAEPVIYATPDTSDEGAALVAHLERQESREAEEVHRTAISTFSQPQNTITENIPSVSVHER